MRLNRLDITRFGMFTDCSVNFGERRKNVPDLHIVYGENEAGKSTAFAAFLDLLFGIETRSRFNFLHPYATMRIGASLELAAGSQEFVRVKRPQNSLLDGKEQPISDRTILVELGGVDRESYRTMFSLDDETLEAGGESVLASKGDLGQLLFSASAGLADLSRKLVTIRDEADRFYKFRARGGELSDLKDQLSALKKERERVDTLASQYAQLIETRDRAAEQYGEVMVARGQTLSRIDEIQRLLNALPRLRVLREIRDRLAPFADLPDPPFNWTEALPKLQQDEVELATRAQSLEDEITQLSGELSAINVDETAIKLSERVGRLADLRARYMTAEKDIPERRLELRKAELEISGILSSIERGGEAEPRRLLLGASVIGALRDLIESRSGIQSAVNSADTELVEARRRVEEAETKLKNAGGGTVGETERNTRISALAAIVSALRTDDHATRLRLATRMRATNIETLADRIRELRPWQGEIEQLVEMIVPNEADMERWRTATSEAQKELGRHAGDVERLATERTRLKAEREAIGNVAGVVSDQEASVVRTTREQAWANHRHTLDVATADAFESALRYDDIVTNSRLGHTADLAKLNQASQALVIVEAALNRSQELRDESTLTLQHLQDEIEAAVCMMAPDLSRMTTLPQIDEWLARREKTLAARRAVLDVERAMKEAEADGADSRNRLEVALVAAEVMHEPDASLETLLATAQVVLDKEGELTALFTAAEDRRRDLKRREHDAGAALSAEQQWIASWGKVCSDCWLGEGDAVPSLATVREVIADIANLGPALEKHAGLADRIMKMQKDQADFIDEVIAIAQALKLAPTSALVLDRAQEIHNFVQKAESAQTNWTAKTQRIEGAREKRKKITETLEIQSKRTREMTSFFGVDSLADVAGKLRDIERRSELQEQANTATRDILNALGLQAMDDAERALDLLDRVSLEAELAELKGRFNDLDQRSHDLFSAHSKAIDRVEAVGGDDIVANIEENRQTIRLEIEEKALYYLRQRVGIAAAEQALRTYRDRHRSSMMARASNAFQMISRGAYTGLATQPEKDSEILIAVSAAGGSKVASDLSKGTRFQLYLALRVAGYHEFAQSHSPVPFVADDIMETFDDFRAEEAFRLFSEMAMVGQVIYLTHHRHLCEIGQRICPEVRVHHLSKTI